MLRIFGTKRITKNRSSFIAARSGILALFLAASRIVFGCSTGFLGGFSCKKNWQAEVVSALLPHAVLPLALTKVQPKQTLNKPPIIITALMK